MENKSFIQFLNNDNGSVLVIALIMLALLTVLGIASTNTTSIDLQITQNDKIYKENFNMAEAAAMHAAQRLIDDGIVGNNYQDTEWVTLCDETATPPCTPTPYPYQTPANWFKADGTTEDAVVTLSDVGTNLYYTAQYNGEFAGSSLGLGTANIRLDKFTCYGLYRDANRGEVLIEVAMTKATF